MAGRKLRQQRNQRLAALTDDEAVALAQSAMPKLNDSQVLIVLATKSDDDLRAVLQTPMPVARRRIADLVTSDPERARLVLSICSHLDSVEKALGITRTPGQRRR